MKQYTVAILGATGAVGTQMLECLNEQEFPVGKLKLLASARSAGKTVEFRGEQVVIEEACPEPLRALRHRTRRCLATISRRSCCPRPSSVAPSW